MRFEMLPARLSSYLLSLRLSFGGTTADEGKGSLSRSCTLERICDG